MLAVIFVFENAKIFGLSGSISFLLLYFIKIALWASLAVIIGLFPRCVPSGITRLRAMVISLAFIFSLLHLLCFVILGFLTSFGKTMYNLSLAGIAFNMLLMLSALVGTELCRSFLINGLSSKSPYTKIIATGLLFMLFNIPMGNLSGLESNMDILKYLTDYVFPQITLSMTASCLVYLAGALPSIIYLGIIRSFAFLSPYIPNPDLIPKMLLNVLLPLLCVFILFRIYAAEALENERALKRGKGTAGWIITGVLSVSIVWFVVGVFPILPSVILTGSMEPVIMPGDIVLVEKTDSDEIEVGDIIMFINADGIFITHRVIEKSSESGEILFVTKGDNNSGADAGHVNSSQLKGRVILIVPDIGKPVLFLRSGDHT